MEKNTELIKPIPKRKSRIKKALLPLLILVFLAAAVLYWLYTRSYISTDDAYVGANVVQISPRVTGQISRLYIVNNQYVNKGQLLFELDSTPFAIAVEKAKAQLQIDQVNLQNTKITVNRILVQKKALPSQSGDDANVKLQAALAEVQISKANLELAQLNLQYCRVFSPTSGWVANVNLRPGNNVEKNQPLFPIISEDEFWVDANFKETELKGIRIGQHAKIVFDMYPDRTYSGTVESISGAAGAAFSLLPPQNATGNWVKITQRVPVRVHVNDRDNKYPLRIGTSATVTIHLYR